MSKLANSILVGAFLTLNGMNLNMAAQNLPTRDQVDNKYKWELGDIYKSDDVWEKDYKFVQEHAAKFKQFEGKITTSAKDLLKAIEFYYETEKVFARIAFYTSMAKDLDLNDGKFQSQFERMSKLGSELASATSFFMPELMQISEDKVKSYIKEEKGLKIYEHRLNEMFRMKSHTLSASEEKLLAQMGPAVESLEATYSILNDADLPFPMVKDPAGQEVQVSHGRYRAALFSPDRAYRERVYKANYVPYRQLLNTFSTLYNGRVKQRLAYSEIKKFDSPREAYLYDDNIPMDVYDNLIKSVRGNVKTFHRWASIKKRVMKLDALHPYDTYASLFPGVQKTYTFDEAKAICLDALKPMGPEYVAALNKAFDSRWIDVYETKGKRSGAYSNGCGCGVHPYILLNWNGTLDDVFTLIHELGHNMHSFFTEKNQPFHYANYSTFVAEVASTTNEALLLDYMIEKAQTKEEKSALIEKFLVNAQQTFMRQTRFADFEMQVHDKAKKGEFMNAEELTKLFAKDYQFYWGPEMVTDEEEGMSWSRIPHLYHYNFYVFQYATGFSCAQAFSEQIKKEGAPAIKRYLEFLSSGSSNYGIEVLKKAGVDMSKPEPISNILAKMEKYMDELEKLLK